MNIKIGMVGLGCPKNQCDAELMLAKLAAEGFEICANAEEADCIVVNTCGFIESAKQESINELLELARLKEEGKLKAIVATGCLAERYTDDILEEMPEVDAVVCIGRNGDIAEACKLALAGERVCLRGKKEDMPMCGERVLSTAPYTAYLRVADGCDNRCSYCAIPLIRGKFRSRPIQELVEEAKSLAANGVKELVVIAQDTTRYGEDLYGEPRLAELLEALCKIEPLRWIRILYCYPDRITQKLLETMASQPKIVKYMDLPIQHCSGKVLKAMNRAGDSASLLELIGNIRKTVKDITLRTTVMVGFPGEGEKEFAELTEFVRKAKFERLGCFVFSPEEGTTAYDMPGRPEDDIGERRMNAVLDVQSLNIDEWTEKMKGKKLETVVIGYSDQAECYVGRTVCDAPEIDGHIYFRSDKKALKEGDFVTVLVTDRIDSDLCGEFVE